MKTTTKVHRRAQSAPDTQVAYEKIDASPLIAPSYWGEQTKISPVWSDVEIGDIGSGFRPASQNRKTELLSKATAERARKELLRASSMSRTEKTMLRAERLRDRNSINKHPFIQGNSPFFFYVIKIDVRAVAAEAKERRKPRTTVYDNTLSPQSKSKFIRNLGKNIDKTSQFFWEEIMPSSNALLSAVKRVEDFSQQALDSNAGLPVEYAKRKIIDAVNLRIIRHISDQFDLTKEERMMMTSEFRLKSKMF
jgi:hypothetical protein